MDSSRLDRAPPTPRMRPGPAVTAALVLACLGASGVAGREEADPVTDSGPFLFAAARMLAGEPGRTDEALDLFERAVAVDPEAPFLRVGLADFLGRLRRLDEAAEHLAVAYRNAPRDVEVLRRYGRIQMELSDRARDREAVDRALEALEALRELAPSDIEGMLLLSRVRVALEELGEAAAVLEELVSYHNGNRQLQRMLAGALREAGEDERAQQVEADMLRFDERSAEARSVEERLESARRESRQGNHTRAIEMLEGVAAELTGSVPVRGALAEEYYRRAMSRGRTPDQRAADLAEALRRLRELPRAARRNQGVRVLEARILGASGRGSEAIDLLEGLRRELPDDPRILRDLVGRLMEEGEWERIRQIGRSLVDGANRGTQQGPDSADFGLGLLVEALRQLGRIDQALAELQSEVERRGETVELLLSQAELLAESGRKRRAMAILRRGALGAERLLRGGEAGEPDVQAILRKAGIYVDLGEARLAGRVLDRFATSGDVRRLVGIADFWRARGRFAESAPLIELALARIRSGAETGFDLDPETLRAGLFFQLGEAYERTRRYEEAAEQFQAVLEIQPENSTAMNYLGYMWADNGENLDQALELVQRAVALEPNNGAYVDSLGWALFRLGEYEEARRHLERANRLAPEDSTILEHLGDVHVALGNTRRAREAYEHALAIAEEEGEENVEAVRRKLSELPRR